MQEYNASISPDPEKWLLLDEEIRLALAMDYVENNEKDIEEGARRIHAVIHVIIENQLAQNVEPTKETYNRLQRQGLDRHEIIHAIGAVISEDIFEIVKGNKKHPFERHKLRLKKLTAKRWKKGKW
jgi:hypothetical protein